MKTTLLIALGILFFPTQIIKAQDKMEAPIEIPTVTKTASSYVDVRYYYYPNMQAYFDTKRALYLIKQNGVWTTSETIDFTSRGYCVRNSAYEMLKDYTGDEPQQFLAVHQLKYPSNFSSRPVPPKKITVPIKTREVIALAN
ncbi:hypothetical protein [Flavobacterium sp.]|uniref:hypothetical protein n=1 Tax=Flavobacterium sp. TaxID=239 RepID=UPI00286BA22A|nr:hypothetical protein [Flavobacterium sp.]